MRIWISPVIFAAVAVFVGYSFASPPVPPPPEQGRISTTTEISCIGDVIVTQSYKNTYASDGELVSPAGSSNAGVDNAVLDAYLDALEDADPLGLNNAGGENDALLGGDPDVPYPFGEAPVFYGTVPGSDGQSWRDIAGYPGNVALNGTLAVSPSRAFALARGIGAEADFAGLPDVDRGLGRGDSIAEITYDYELSANNGTTELRKTFTATDAETPNLEVSQDIAYVADAGSIGAKAEMNETAGMTIVSYGTSSIGGALTGAASLCPWVQRGTSGGSAGGLPATNELIAGGSSFDATIIEAETDAAVTTTDVPSFSYRIDAAGPLDLGGIGIGRISAAFAVQIQEGGGPYVPPTTRTVYVDALGNVVDFNPANTNDQEALIEGRIVPVTVELPGTGVPPLAKFEQYEEFASASGFWTFSKEMSYNSIIPGSGAPAAGNIVDGLLP
jgi:hypothetical protein